MKLWILRIQRRASSACKRARLQALPMHFWRPSENTVLAPCLVKKAEIQKSNLSHVISAQQIAGFFGFQPHQSNLKAFSLAVLCLRWWGGCQGTSVTSTNLLSRPMPSQRGWCCFQDDLGSPEPFSLSFLAVKNMCCY